jgi:beta-glucanase (GH16 family)
MDGDFTGDWHTYGMLWTPTSLQFYFDGVPDPEKTFTDPKMIPQTAMYAIFQMATGDNTYNTPPNQVMKVDYVHIFSSAK